MPRPRSQETRRNRRNAQGSPSNDERRAGTRRPRARILIVCEGSQTEPLYFEALLAEYKLTNTVVIEGGAGDPLHLLETAKKSRADYDVVWCVFDRDSWPPDRFDNAVAACDGTKLKAAWSNEAFELWYVLHFQYLSTAVLGKGTSKVGTTARAYYQQQLKTAACLGSYEKNDPLLWAKLRDRLETAQSNAHRLLKQYDASVPPHDCAPATCVVHLVEELIASAQFLV